MDPPNSDIEALASPHRAVSNETIDILNHQPTPTLTPDEELELRPSLSWWKRPSVVWMLCTVPFSALAMGATLAPKVEMYTELVCRVHKPHLIAGQVLSLVSSTAECAKDPVIAAATSRLIAVVTTTTGVLSCLTTAWWGSFSDRHGRIPVLTLSMFGLFCTEVNFILVARFFDRLPGGYWFLLIGFIIEGVFGGLTAGSAAMHAYVADISLPETRSRSFSLVSGFFMGGFALGPTLGGLLIALTKNTISVFYLAVATHLVFALFSWLIVPESLTRRQMLLSTIKYESELANEIRSNGARGQVKRVFKFLSPLAIFVPVITDEAGINPLKAARDWNLLILVVAYAFTVLNTGSFPYIFQYAAATFSWGPDIIGYWLSILGASRVVHLILILPVVIYLINYFSRPSSRRSSTVQTEQDPLLSNNTTTQGNHKPKHSPRFDLNIARVSLLISITVYVLMALATHPLLFFGAGLISSLGAGFEPAINAVALDLFYNTRRRHHDGGVESESGKLFGAMSVLQALSAQIIGPAVYGLLYATTVSTVPQTIFFMAAGSVAVSFILLLSARIPKGTITVTTTVANEDEIGR